MIKTYSNVVRNDTALSFRISRMEDIWDERNGQKDEPHRHDYFTVLVVKAAKGLHVIDFHEYPFAENQVFFVSPGQIHQVAENQKSFGFALLFSSRFIADNNIPIHFIDDLNLFNDHGHSPPLNIDTEEFEKLVNFCEEMFRLSSKGIKYKEQAISSYLQLFLISCNNLCSLSLENTQNQEAANSILKNFKNLVNENYNLWHQTSDYADALNVTPDYLNRVVKSLTGKTSKQFIQARVVTEARRLLYFSGQTSKEIAFHLGFSEPANFSAFFKKHTGKSPSVFAKFA